MAGTPATGLARRRWPAVVLLALAGLAALAAIAGWAALGTRVGRRAVLDRLAPRIERTTGLALAVDDFTVSPLRGVLVLRGIRLGVPGAPPLLTAERITIDADPRRLADTPLVLRRVAVTRPRLDFAAPFPGLPARRPTSEVTPAIEVSSFAVQGGAVDGGPIPEAVAPWLAGWRADGIEVTGSYRGGVLEALATLETVQLTRPGGRRLDLRVAARVGGVPGGAMRVDELRVDGDGLELEASGAGDLATRAGRARFRLRADPDRVAPELGLGGDVSAEGGVDWNGATAVTVAARGLRAAAVERFAEVPPAWRSALDGTLVDADAELRAGSAPWRPLASTARLRWRDGATALADATAAFTPGDDHAAALVFDAGLLPASPGERRARGTLQLSDWREPAGVRLDNVRLRLDLPDLAAAHAELRSRWPQLVPALDPTWPVRGAFRLEATANGAAADPVVVATAEWLPEPGSRATVEASGRPLSATGEATVVMDRLTLPAVLPGAAGVIAGRVTVRGSARVYTATAALDGSGLTLVAGAPAIDALHLEAATDGREVRIGSLEATVAGRRLLASGRVDAALPLRAAELAGVVTDPVRGFADARFAAALSDGVLRLDVPDASGPAGTLAVEAAVPLGALRALPGVGERLTALPVVSADGPALLRITAPDIDTCTLLPSLGLEEIEPRLRGDVVAELWLDPAAPTASTGTVRVANLRLDSGGASLQATSDLVVEAANGVVNLRPFELRAGAARLRLVGAGVLANSFRPGLDPPAALLASFGLNAHGELPAAALTPYLPGGTATGTLTVALAAHGSPASPTGEVRVGGTGAVLELPVPYPTRIEQPELQLSYENGELLIESGTARVNGGRVELSGWRAADGEVYGRAHLDALAYRLNFGLRALLGGELELSLPAGGRGRLTGRLTLERGLLDRDVDLERELLPWLFAPVETPGSEESILDEIDLDVAVDTVEGVRVRNNLADLRAGWEELTIVGIAWSPVIVGSLEVDGGGLVFAFGQTVRLDRAVVTFTGDPFTDPQLELETTTSLEDPSLVGFGEGEDLFAQRWESAAVEDAAAEALTAGVASYYGQRLLSRFGERVGLGQLRVRPLLIASEADPTARLTVTQDLSRNVAFAVSLDLRNADRQTYLVDLHGFRRLPRMNFQVFTDDTGIDGAMLQQRLELGGPPPEHEGAEVLGRFVVEGPADLKRGAVRRAAGLRRGDPLPPGALTDVEIELTDWLRRRGHPEPGVAVTRIAGERPGVADLHVRLEPGPVARFEFAGDELPRVTRDAVRALYRAGPGEAQSLVEIERTAARALRARNHLDPRVRAIAAPDGEGGDRVVRVEVAAGRTAMLGELEFVGVDGDDAAFLRGRFAGPVERTELAAGVPAADRRLEASLAALGFTRPAVRSRELSADGSRLVVEVATGERRTIGEVTLEGLAEPERARLAAALPIAPGDPARADRIQLAALTIEQDLKSRGWAEARVHPHVAGADDSRVAVRLDVVDGPQFRLDGVAFDGLRWTGERFARAVADLEPGVPYQPREASRARARLFRTGLFSAVTARTDKSDDGTATVTFDVRERPRFGLGYGVRWDDEVGWALVVDAVDRNAFGRGLTAGARASYQSDDRSGRLYLLASDLWRSDVDLEVFAEFRRSYEGDVLRFVIDESVVSLQLSRLLARSLTGQLYARYKTTRLALVEEDPFFPFDATRITHPYLGGQLIWDRRDDPLLATRGLLATADLSGSGDWIGSDYHYLRLYAQLAGFTEALRVASRPVVWAQSLRVGLAAWSDDSLLLDARFNAGGPYSVRGYPRESLGPLDPYLGLPTGGGAMVVINEELRTLIFEGVWALAFVDAGQVWEEVGDIDTDLATSIGLGTRLVTPVGVIRVDAAWPLDRRSGDPTWKLYLGLGSTF
jgi:outer membrane translocation and assembly module TamA